MRHPSLLALLFTIGTLSSLRGESEAPLLCIELVTVNGTRSAELSFEAENECFYVIERKIGSGDWSVFRIVMGEGGTFTLSDPLLSETVLYRVSEGFDQPPVMRPPDLSATDDSSPAPEPSVLLLLALTAFGFAGRRR